ncbi:MAG: outer membrane lipoprotein carrier protein LolA, partial [Mariprofundaceae bacterium]
MALWLALSGAPALADAAEVSGQGRALFAHALERLADAPGLRCTFVQRIVYADAAGREQRFSGELAVRRPGRFRWRYDSP